MKFKNWTRDDSVPNYPRWVKSFGGGQVSVGIGDNLTVTFSYGANSDFSMSSTRWRKDRIISEKDMMDFVDFCGGRCVKQDIKDYEFASKDRLDEIDRVFKSME